MSIDPNKSFAMKATNRLYTLEFKKDTSGSTEITAVDSETPALSFGKRLAIAWAILTGQKSLGECVFPIRLRNTDLYNMSYIHRPDKVVERIVEKIVEVPAKAIVTSTKPAQKPKEKKPAKAKKQNTES